MGSGGRSRRQRGVALTRSVRRLLGFVAGFGVLLVSLASGYVFGMQHLEGKPRSFWEGLEFAAGALSTTGFGRDVHWTHPAMVVFVALVQFSGVFLLFLLVPILLIPFLEERLGRRFPAPSRGLSGHLVIYRWGSAVESLLDLAAAGVPVVVLDPDPAPLRRLAERGVPVVLGDADAASLSRTGLSRARAVVANGRDDENGAAILAVRESGFRGEVVAFVEDPNHRKALALAGANRVFTPRHVLGAALAARASDRVSPSIAGLDTLGEKLCVRETRIEQGSQLAGRTVGESGLGERTGAAVLGVWKRGEFVAPVGFGTRLDERDVAVAAGSEASVAELARLAGGSALRRREGRIVVAGHGEVGRAATDVLRTVGEVPFAVDRQPGEGVDLVGDVLHGSVFERAGVREARAVVLALGGDSATLFATLLVRELDPEVLIVARANEAASVDRIHRAGADFVLSMSRVAAGIVAGSLFGRHSMGLDGGLEIAELPGARFEGRRVLHLGLREASGVTVVAVARGDEVLVAFEGIVVEPGDRIYVCGPREAVDEARGDRQDGESRAV